MASGLVIPLSLNPRAWLDGLRVVDNSLEDLETDLAEVENAGDTLERALRDNFDGIARSTGKVERSLDDVDRELSTVEEEAGQSAKEFGAAFRGDPVEALEEVQSYIAEISAKWLPGFAGAVLTIAGGAVFGVLLTQVEKWREKQQQIQDQATDLLGTYREQTGQLEAIENQYADVIQQQILSKFWESLTLDETTKLFEAMGLLGLAQSDINDLILAGATSTGDVLRETENLGNAQQGVFDASKAISQVIGEEAEAYRLVGEAIDREVLARYQALRREFAENPLTFTIEYGRVAGVNSVGGFIP